MSASFDYLPRAHSLHAVMITVPYSLVLLSIFHVGALPQEGFIFFNWQSLHIRISLHVTENFFIFKSMGFFSFLKTSNQVINVVLYLQLD